MFSIRQIARETGLKLNKIIALAASNDPFNACQTPATKRDAEWFSHWFTELGFHGSNGIHLRRIHYKIISQETPVLMPNGEPYQNTENCWKFLTHSAKQARYGKLVSLEAFDDRRNPDPLIFRIGNETIADRLEVEMGNSGIYFPEFPDPPSLSFRSARADQKYHLEIWCEKSTMNDVLKPICQRYKANLVTGLGEMSITQCRRLVDRVESLKMPCRIFYISDFDPAGKSMPVAVARKIEWLIRDRGMETDLKLFQIALTQAQVQELGLPRTPIKESEARKDKFEARYGQDAVELDAIEAIHPGTLSEIVKAAILPYYDRTLENRISSRRSDIYERISESRAEVIARHDVSDLRSEWETIEAEYRAKIEGLMERISDRYRTIASELEEALPDMAEFPIPEPIEPDDEPIAILDTQRDYLDQIQFYQAFQSGKECLEIDPVQHPRQTDLFAA